jgi:tight adherence protein B
LDFTLKQAGIPILGAEFIIIILILAIGGTFATFVVTLNIKLAPIVGLGIPMLILLWIKVRINKRRQAFTEQLGDCLTTVSNALRAGYSFQQAMDVVSREILRRYLTR